LVSQGPTYRVQFRRRHEGKTDYNLRRELIKSGKPRLVIRGSLKHMSVQIIEAKSGGDHTLAAANSIELAKKYKWLGSCGNLPAAYLTGLIAGHRASSKGVKEAVLDFGLSASSKGSRISAALKGVIDSGIKVPFNEKIMPDKSRIIGEHIATYAKKLAASNSELYQRVFANYIGRKLKPESLPEHFKEIEEKITQSEAPKIKGVPHVPKRS
jgi:large subunit ribosomal protein L18